MTTAITLTYYGVEGTGRTVTDAKKDAGRKIEQSLAGDYNPELLTYRGYSILLYRTPDGWSSHLTADKDGLREGRIYGCSRNDYTTAKSEALAHLAQLGWEPEDGQNQPEFLKDRPAIAGFRTWSEFQLRYREAIARGMNSNDAHSYAGRNPCRAELWATTAA